MSGVAGLHGQSGQPNWPKNNVIAKPLFPRNDPWLLKQAAHVVQALFHQAERSHDPYTLSVPRFAALMLKRYKLATSRLKNPLVSHRGT